MQFHKYIFCKFTEKKKHNLELYIDTAKIQINIKFYLLAALSQGKSKLLYNIHKKSNIVLVDTFWGQV